MCGKYCMASLEKHVHVALTNQNEEGVIFSQSHLEQKPQVTWPMFVFPPFPLNFRWITVR